MKCKNIFLILFVLFVLFCIGLLLWIFRIKCRDNYNQKNTLNIEDIEDDEDEDDEDEDEISNLLPGDNPWNMLTSQGKPMYRNAILALFTFYHYLMYPKDNRIEEGKLHLPTTTLRKKEWKEINDKLDMGTYNDPSDQIVKLCVDTLFEFDALNGGYFGDTTSPDVEKVYNTMYYAFGFSTNDRTKLNNTTNAFYKTSLYNFFISDKTIVNTPLKWVAIYRFFKDLEEKGTPFPRQYNWIKNFNIGPSKTGQISWLITFLSMWIKVPCKYDPTYDWRKEKRQRVQKFLKILQRGLLVWHKQKHQNPPVKIIRSGIAPHVFLACAKIALEGAGYKGGIDENGSTAMGDFGYVDKDSPAGTTTGYGSTNNVRPYTEVQKTIDRASTVTEAAKFLCEDQGTATRYPFLATCRFLLSDLTTFTENLCNSQDLYLNRDGTGVTNTTYNNFASKSCIDIAVVSSVWFNNHTVDEINAQSFANKFLNDPDGSRFKNLFLEPFPLINESKNDPTYFTGVPANLKEKVTLPSSSSYYIIDNINNCKHLIPRKPLAWDHPVWGSPSHSPTPSPTPPSAEEDSELVKTCKESTGWKTNCQDFVLSSTKLGLGDGANGWNSHPFSPSPSPNPYYTNGINHISDSPTHGRKFLNLHPNNNKHFTCPYGTCGSLQTELNGNKICNDSKALNMNEVCNSNHPCPWWTKHIASCISGNSVDPKWPGESEHCVTGCYNTDPDENSVYHLIPPSEKVTGKLLTAEDYYCCVGTTGWSDTTSGVAAGTSDNSGTCANTSYPSPPSPTPPPPPTPDVCSTDTSVQDCRNDAPPCSFIKKPFQSGVTPSFYKSDGTLNTSSLKTHEVNMTAPNPNDELHYSFDSYVPMIGGLDNSSTSSNLYLNMDTPTGVFINANLAITNNNCNKSGNCSSYPVDTEELGDTVINLHGLGIGARRIATKSVLWKDKVTIHLISPIIYTRPVSSTVKIKTHDNTKKHWCCVNPKREAIQTDRLGPNPDKWVQAWIGGNNLTYMYSYNGPLNKQAYDAWRAEKNDDCQQHDGYGPWNGIAQNQIPGNGDEPYAQISEGPNGGDYLVDDYLKFDENCKVDSIYKWECVPNLEEKTVSCEPILTKKQLVPPTRFIDKRVCQSYCEAIDTSNFETSNVVTGFAKAISGKYETYFLADLITMRMGQFREQEDSEGVLDPLDFTGVNFTSYWIASKIIQNALLNISPLLNAIDKQPKPSPPTPSPPTPSPTPYVSESCCRDPIYDLSKFFGKIKFHNDSSTGNLKKLQASIIKSGYSYNTNLPSSSSPSPTPTPAADPCNAYTSSLDCSNKAECVWAGIGNDEVRCRSKIEMPSLFSLDYCPPSPPSPTPAFDPTVFPRKKSFCPSIMTGNAAFKNEFKDEV